MKKLLNCVFWALLLVAGAADINIAEININDYGADSMLKPARTFYVSKAGNDANDGLSQEHAWLTIKGGVKDLRAGDTLFSRQAATADAAKPRRILIPRSSIHIFRPVEQFSMIA